MASIRKKSTSVFWFACYYAEDGSRKNRSTRTTDRKEALRIADALEQAHARRMTEGQMRRVLSDLSERLTGAPLASATLQEFAAQWLQRKQGEVSSSAHLAYKNAVNEFVTHTPAKANVGIQYVTPSDIATFRDKAAAASSPKTANNKLKILRTMLQTAWRDGFISENPAAKVAMLKTEDSIRRPFTVPELRKLLAVASDEWRGMTLVGLYTGQRLKDTHVDEAAKRAAFEKLPDVLA